MVSLRSVQVLMGLGVRVWEGFQDFEWDWEGSRGSGPGFYRLTLAERCQRSLARMVWIWKRSVSCPMTVSIFLRMFNRQILSVIVWKNRRQFFSPKLPPPVSDKRCRMIENRTNLFTYLDSLLISWSFIVFPLPSSLPVRMSGRLRRRSRGKNPRKFRPPSSSQIRLTIVVLSEKRWAQNG